MTPKVSICLPNLNTRRYLPDRFGSIAQQTFTDWELLVYDSYSDDGAWEYIRDIARKNPRIRAWQGPRAGTPASWNPCIREATGEYIYIATSDDTMSPDCLEQLVAALEAHPECGLAHCRLRAIDEHGQDRMDISDWWWHGSAFALTSGPLLTRTHVRRAPFDGLLHLLGGSVYISITQLLIRRSLFDTIGDFESRWGSVGDFNWCMRASLATSTVHVPETWGGWRVHPEQATARTSLVSEAHAIRVDRMIDHAIEASQHLLDPVIRYRLASDWQQSAKELRRYMRDIDECRGNVDFGRMLARRVLAGSVPAREHVRLRLRGRSMQDWVTERLEEAGFGQMVVADPAPVRSRLSSR